LLPVIKLCTIELRALIMAVRRSDGRLGRTFDDLRGMVPMDTLYTAVATATHGRDGRAISSDGKLDLQLAIPVEMGGNGQGTNPEQLFAAGYAACFASALGLVGRQAKVDVTDAAVTGEVGIGKQGEGFGLAVTLRVELP